VNWRSRKLGTNRAEIVIAISALISVVSLATLHRQWSVILWLVAISLCAYYFWFQRLETWEPVLKLAPSSTVGPLLLVLVAAAAVRLYKLVELPLGAFVDEIFAVNTSLLLLEKPVDAFGHTLFISEAWGQDHPNLFLYINAFILKWFGVTYWTTKLLTVLPEVMACGAVLLIAQRIFARPVAIATALLFAFAHWSIRLSRYGWDASIMIATFAIAIWLLLCAWESGRLLFFYLSGVAAGLCLYSYIASRIVLLSLITFWVLEWCLRRNRALVRQALPFAIGTVTAAYPFWGYYVYDAGAFWRRTSQVSVFSTDHPFLTIIQNLPRHALMFNWAGGTFARDNFPGLPMMDPLTGLLLIVGIVVVFRSLKTSASRFLLCIFVLNFAGAIFSISQEGAPYVYRAVAVIVPAFLIVGFGLQQLRRKLGTWSLLLLCPLIILLNLYLYFDFEAKNTAGMRVMAYGPRMIGLEVAQDNSPVWLVGLDTPHQTEILANQAEAYAQANPAVILPPVLRRLAIINFSGRYDTARSLAQNLDSPRGIHFVDNAASIETNHLPGSKIIFKDADDTTRLALVRQGAFFRLIRNVASEPFLIVATLPTQKSSHQETRR
jgi:hypothetical protein